MKNEKIWTRQIIPAFLLFLVVAALGFVFVKIIISSGITRGPDQVFGDQHLKTAVALIELHKVRYGHYPDTLSDLQYTGQWDTIALNNVSYHVSSDLNSYYVEVSVGWVGKPENLQMPEEFWQGTGYDISLKKKE